MDLDYVLLQLCSLSLPVECMDHFVESCVRRFEVDHCFRIVNPSSEGSVALDQVNNLLTIKLSIYLMCIIFVSFNKNKGSYFLVLSSVYIPKSLGYSISNLSNFQIHLGF